MGSGSGLRGIGDNITVASIGQADDVALVSNSIHNLRNLVQMTNEYCKKYCVTLFLEKTKLLAFGPQKSLQMYYDKFVSNINIKSNNIQFANEAKHGGILHSVHGSLPSLLARLSAHRKAVMAVLNVGLARGHRRNLATVLRVEQIYGAPVLLSGLSSLVLNKMEVEYLDHHYKKTLESLRKLYPATPSTVVHFLGGSLPAPALLHLAMFSVLGMISRLENNILLRIVLQPSHGSLILTISAHSTPFPQNLNFSQANCQNPPSRKLLKLQFLTSGNRSLFGILVNYLP